MLLVATNICNISELCLLLVVVESVKHVGKEMKRCGTIRYSEVKNGHSEEAPLRIQCVKATEEIQQIQGNSCYRTGKGNCREVYADISNWDRR